MAGYTNTPTSRGSPKILRQRRVVRMSPLNGDAARKTKSSTRKTADLSPQEILERNAKERERVHAVNDQYQVSGKPHNALCFMSLQVKCYGIFTLSDSDSDFKPNGYIAPCRSFHAAWSDSDSNPNCQLQEWDQNPSPYPSPSPAK